MEKLGVSVISTILDEVATQHSWPSPNTKDSLGQKALANERVAYFQHLAE
jgi:hypothetical protein